MSRRVPVELGERSYDVVIDDSYDALRDVAARAAPGRAGHASRSRPARRRARAARALADAGVEHERFLMGEGEDAKSLATVEELSRGFAQWGLLRGDLVVAVGGGVVGDTAGFAAAVYYRGVDVVQVPTTLLAMVDSAIGGKTGVNLPEGKNLVGAFHQPRARVREPAVLRDAARPRVPLRSRRGRQVRVDGRRLRVGARRRARRPRSRRARRRDRALRRDQGRGSSPPTSTSAPGVRAVLNYGHTVAHALETATGHALLHGEAVAVGLVFAAHLGAVLERVPPELVDAHRGASCSALGLPTYAPPGLRADDLLAIMARDKKSGGGLTFVLDGPNGIERVDDPDPGAVRKALAAIRVEA